MCCGGESGAAAAPRPRGLIDALWDPQDRSERMARLGMAAGLLEASAPSTDPSHGSLGYVLGQGLQGAMQGLQGGDDDRTRIPGDTPGDTPADAPGAATGAAAPRDTVVVRTMEELAALPPGTPYRFPDGSGGIRT